MKERTNGMNKSIKLKILHFTFSFLIFNSEIYFSLKKKNPTTMEKGRRKKIKIKILFS